MELYKKTSECSGCSACAQVCPRGAIAMKADGMGFAYPEIDQAACAGCMACLRVCRAATVSVAEDETASYAACALSEEVRLRGSSGGLFECLAEAVIRRGGVVFGAAFDEGFRVRHQMALSMEEVMPMLQSKYVQSEIGGAYREAKLLLDGRIPVLFTGTPCQIAGLRAFLGRDYENLFTQDIVCHGAPAPAVWRAYVGLREARAGAKAKGVSFRDKSEGWSDFRVRFAFEDDSEYAAPFREDPYMKGFLANLYLRPSCYECRHKGAKRISSITLADFWGIQKVLPGIQDAEKGVSLVLAHGEKGRALLSMIASQIWCAPVDPAAALAGNSSAVRPAPIHPGAAQFHKSFGKGEVDGLIGTCLRVGLLRRVKRRLASLCSRFDSNAASRMPDKGFPGRNAPVRPA